MSYHCSLSQINPSPSSSRGAPAWLLARLKEIEDLNFIPNPFASIYELCRELELSPRKLSHWRLVKCELGEINGLPKSRGLLVAASGPECLIWAGGTTHYIGHRDWWVREIEEPTERVKQPKKDRLVDIFDDPGFQV